MVVKEIFNEIFWSIIKNSKCIKETAIYSTTAREAFFKRNKIICFYIDVRIKLSFCLEKMV